MCTAVHWTKAVNLKIDGIGLHRETINSILLDASSNLIAKSFSAQSWNDKDTTNILLHATQAANSISNCLQQINALDLMLQVMIWHTGRAYMVIYNWMITTGPLFAYTLIKHLDTHGEASLLALSPQLRCLIIHVTNYVVAVQEAKNNNIPTPVPATTSQ
ncbi:hypothetical protein BV22DRAFT_1050692 [Leucogyrophana mollusca]|uniref:Uncharacterized protein n=1 Tax=Leucogyrophana mollusca TaxID=85980 RepID=A0ACB8B2T0_9AGAM|nr:hypothetical protein BV22DRAFT_1050692 [Leucogyrophana mollusca]